MVSDAALRLDLMRKPRVGTAHHWGLDIFFIKVILDQGHSSRTTLTSTGRVDA
jgi:hypothetical protein